MANPQLQDGYVKLANEILEALVRSNLSGTELAIILHLIRKTYGFNKKQDEISISQFLKAIPVTKPTLCKCLRNLQLVNIIKLVKKGNSLKRSNLYEFNKNYETWQLVKKYKLVKVWKRTSKGLDNQLVSKPLHTKYTLTKDTLTKDNRDRFNQIWDKYPQRTGRKSAESHFKASVKTEQDFQDIQTALKNYLESKRVAQGFVQNGSTWFNNWQDWINFKDPFCKLCKGKGKYMSGTGYEIKCKCNEK